jgi:riboflavin synthase
MFTGIIQNIEQVKSIHKEPALHTLVITTNAEFTAGLTLGSSIAINGVCLTVVDFNSNEMTFQIMQSTLDCTNLGQLHINDWVNIERSLRVGDEIGGHLISGHVETTAQIVSIEKPHELNWIVTLQTKPHWLNYLFPKGFICLDGVSLTLQEIHAHNHTFTVHLIPETIKRTIFPYKTVGSSINMDIDKQTITIVDTVIKDIGEAPYQNVDNRLN